MNKIALAGRTLNFILYDVDLNGIPELFAFMDGTNGFNRYMDFAIYKGLVSSDGYYGSGGYAKTNDFYRYRGSDPKYATRCVAYNGSLIYEEHDYGSTANVGYARKEADGRFNGLSLLSKTEQAFNDYVKYFEQNYEKLQPAIYKSGMNLEDYWIR